MPMRGICNNPNKSLKMRDEVGWEANLVTIQVKPTTLVYNVNPLPDKTNRFLPTTQIYICLLLGKGNAPLAKPKRIFKTRFPPPGAYVPPRVWLNPPHPPLSVSHTPPFVMHRCPYPIPNLA
jgi:hypothetical protein